MRPPEDPTDFTNRLRTLESRNRALCVVTALLALAFVLAEVVPRTTLRAERYVLVDETGRQRGIWRVRESEPALILQDEQGIWRATLRSGEGASSLELSRPGSEGSAWLGSDAEGARLYLTDEGGTEAELTGGRGTPELRLRGEGGRRRLRPPSGSDDQ